MSTQLCKLLKIGRKRVAAGWTQKRYKRTVRGKLRYCATGALIGPKADEDDVLTRLQREARSILEKAMRDTKSAREISPITTIEGYNDRPQTKKEDILGIYDEAIKATCEAPSDPQ